MLARCLVSLLLLLGSSGLARAGGTIATGPARPPIPGSLVCRIANVGDKDVVLESSIFDLNGSDLGGVSPGTTVPPKAVGASASNNPGARFCVVSITKGTKKSVRVTLEVLDGSGNLLATLVGQ